MQITRIKFVSHTGKDNKDKGDTVTVQLISGNEVVANYGPAHIDLNFNDHSNNEWFIDSAAGLRRPFDLAECPRASIVVAKSGDKGWWSAFTVYGYDAEGREYRLLKTTDQVLFGNRAEIDFNPLKAEIRRKNWEGGKAYEFPLTCTP
jgi:hypothetical protein